MEKITLLPSLVTAVNAFLVGMGKIEELLAKCHHTRDGDPGAWDEAQELRKKFRCDFHLPELPDISPKSIISGAGQWGDGGFVPSVWVILDDGDFRKMAEFMSRSFRVVEAEETRLTDEALDIAKDIECGFTATVTPITRPAWEFIDEFRSLCPEAFSVGYEREYEGIRFMTETEWNRQLSKMRAETEAEGKILDASQGTHTVN